MVLVLSLSSVSPWSPIISFGPLLFHLPEDMLWSVEGRTSTLPLDWIKMALIDDGRCDCGSKDVPQFRGRHTCLPADLESMSKIEDMRSPGLE